MRFIEGYRAIAASAAIALLAGCSAPEEAAQSDGSAQGTGGETALSPESLEMAETAWLSVSEEGEVFTTYLDGDGRYRDQRGGEVVFGGTWEQNASRELCFTPDAGEGKCWAHRAPGLDGVMRATNADGRAIEVRRVAYSPPPSAVEASADGEDSAETGAGETGAADNDTQGTRG